MIKNILLNIMSKELEPLKVIKHIRETFGVYPDYSRGCYKFGVLLKMIFDNAELYYNSDHIICKIDNVFYDINGVVTKTDDYLPMNMFGNEIENTLKKDVVSLNLY